MNNNEEVNNFIVIYIIQILCSLGLIFVLICNDFQMRGSIGALFFAIVAPIVSWSYYNKNKTVYHKNTSTVQPNITNIEKKKSINYYSEKFGKYINNEEYDKANKIADKMVDLYPDCATSYLARAHKFLHCNEEHEIQNCISDLKKAIELDPENEGVQNAITTFIIGGLLACATTAKDKDLVKYDLLFKNLDISTIRTLVTIAQDNDTVKSYLEFISNKIDENNSKLSYLYSSRAFFKIHMAFEEYDKDVSNDIEKSIKIDPNSIFNKFVRLYYFSYYFYHKLNDNLLRVSDDAILSFEQLPIIKIELVNNI